jgi:hypothetical protein
MIGTSTLVKLSELLQEIVGDRKRVGHVPLAVETLSAAV